TLRRPVWSGRGWTFWEAPVALLRVSTRKPRHIIGDGPVVAGRHFERRRRQLLPQFERQGPCLECFQDLCILARTRNDADVSMVLRRRANHAGPADVDVFDRLFDADRKSTRLNSSHVKISYAVFCL